MTFELKDSIPGAERFSTYDIANKIEQNPNCWVDSLSNEHIEVHSRTCEKEAFYNALTKIVSESKLNGKMTAKKEKLLVNNKKTVINYFILDGKMSC